MKQAIALAFWMPGVDQRLFGISEREDTLNLKMTNGTDPYQLFATDHVHAPGSPSPLYGSIPYIMGLSNATATSLLWPNSARTTIDLEIAE